MKKILIMLDGTKFSAGAFEFARQLNELQPILLVGIFLPQLRYACLWNCAAAMSGPLYLPEAAQQKIDLEEKQVVEENLADFERLCLKNNISFRVHNDVYDFSLAELRKETRFADLLIISDESFLEDFNTNSSESIKKVYHNAECPVLVVPEKFEFPKKNIIAYDGSESSVFALKQFCSLFPELCNNETVLLHLKAGDEPGIPDQEYVEELASQHYKNLTLQKLRVTPGKYFDLWLEKENKPILITGSYGRSLLSQVFKKSFVSDIIPGHRFPVFIAHR